MNRKFLWISTIALLVVCGAAVLTCSNSSDDNLVAVSPTDDSSQFVTLTDAVPDAILEIRYFGTYNFDRMLPYE